MRILHVINSLVVGGAQQMLVKLVEAQAGSEVQNTILCFRAGPLLEQIDTSCVKVIDLAIARNRSLSQIRRGIRGTIDEQQPDLIQSWMYAANLACSMAGAHHNHPLAWNIRHSVSSLRHEKPGTMVSIVASIPYARTASAIVYNAHVSARQHEKLGYGRDRTVILPNGFDVDRFCTSDALRSSARGAMGLATATGPILGHVGRWHPQKDHRMLLKAFKRVKQHLPDAQLLLCGPGVDSGNRALMALLEQDQLQSSVVLLGSLEHTEMVYRALDLFVLSSSYGEAFPNVLGEAMACEVPCIATDVGDSASLIESLGLVVAPGDCDAMAAAMLTQLGLDDRKRTELGKAGRARIQQNYDIKKISSNYADLYAGMIAKHGDSR